jgi:hypothetical protein
MIEIKMNRELFISQINAYLKLAKGVQEVELADNHLNLSCSDGGIRIPAICKQAFQTTIHKGNLEQIVKFNKRSKKQSLKEITFTLDPEAKRLKSFEITVNTGKVVFL